MSVSRAASPRPEAGIATNNKSIEQSAARDEGFLSDCRLPEFENASDFDASRWTVNVKRIVDCPFSRSIDEAHLIFPMLERNSGVRLPFRQLGLPIGGAVTHLVKTHFHRQPDATERGRSHDQVDFEWCARCRWLPDLHGVLRFRIAGVDTRVALHADYAPPFGMLGSLFDRLVGRRLAVATATDLVDRLATVLESRWADELKRHPTDRSTVDPSVSR